MYDQRLPIVDDDDGIWGDILRKYLLKEHYDTGVDDAANGGHKNVTIRAGTAGAGGAPLKFTTGTLLTTPEAGAMEFVLDNLYMTQDSGTRKKVALYDITGANGDMYYRNGSNDFTRLAAGTASQILTLTGSPALPTWQTLSAYTSGGTDVAVADGGTGRSSSGTIYGILAAGTTTTGPQQTISPGTSGQFLKSAGAGALAAFASLTTADIGSGTFAIGRIPTGTTSTTVSLGNHTHTKADVGLANVDNTSDANKPVSIATQNTINALTVDSLARAKKQGYQPAGSDAYYKLATFPIDDSANYASMIIQGRLGGWTNSNMATWNILLANRSNANDGVTVKAAISAVGDMDTAIGCCDLVVYAQANKSAILYVRVPSDQYFAYDLSYNSMQATPGYTGIAETPTGTDVWHLWSAPRFDQQVTPRSAFNNLNIYNVRDYGAVGNGTTDDRAAIQSCIDASVPGSTILFPPGTYRVNNTIYLKGLRTYKGTAAGQTGYCVIKLGANITAPIVASEVYGTARTTCDDPLLIEDLCIDGNKAVQTTGTATGLLLINYWSTAQRLYIRNCSGPAIKLTDAKASGTVTNSCSENKVLHCKLTDCQYGILQESNNGISNQDGYADDNLISNVVSGIVLGRGAGWSVRRNHTYGVSQYGINVSAAYATVVSDNYIEDFGSAGASGYYSGISLTQLNDRASTVSGNHVSVAAVAGAARLDCYNLRAGGSQTQAVITMAANSAFGTTASNTYGMFMEVQSGGALTVGRSGHVYTAIDVSRYESINSGVRLSSQDQIVPVSARSSAYTLGLWDIGAAVEMTSASAVNVTVPANSSQAFPIGTLLEIVQTGVGAVTIVAESGVTLNTAGTLTTRAQYSTVTLRKRAADAWLVAGDTV